MEDILQRRGSIASEDGMEIDNMLIDDICSLRSSPSIEYDYVDADVEYAQARVYNLNVLLHCREIYGSTINRLSRGRSRYLQRHLERWNESNNLVCCRGKKINKSSERDIQPCILDPSPRSTIAATFNTHGDLLASTHGDHTVKLSDFSTGRCIRSLIGHKRTPWVVRFNPVHSSILVSGSLDREVRLWDALSGECLKAYSFSRPIASVSFHADGSVLAIATGHKLYTWRIWKATDGDDDMVSSNDSGILPKDVFPNMILRTQRSLRAVQFHPLGAPYLLTAELHQIISHKELLEQLPLPLAQDFDNSFEVQSDVSLGHSSDSCLQAIGGHTMSAALAAANAIRRLQENVNSETLTWDAAFAAATAAIASSVNEYNADLVYPATRQESTVQYGRNNEYGADITMGADPGGRIGGLVGTVASAASYANRTGSRVTVRTDNRLQHFHTLQNLPSLCSESTSQETDRATAAAAAAAVTAAAASFPGPEQPCCVKLNIWPFPPSSSSQLLESAAPLLSLSNVVLCSEMGSHFSPCGRYLVVAVVCHTPGEADSVLQDYEYMDEGVGAGYEPGKISYELRILSMEPGTFGRVLAARNLAAAHCLTSIQFSPTSQLILVAYGRRHMSLLESLVAEDGTITPLHTIIEMYSLPNLKLVETFASAEDEVNVATFHPVCGEGIAYGTKEGRLQRILRRPIDVNGNSINYCEWKN